MVQYQCKLCNKCFKQKNDYNRHLNKKYPCINIDEMKNIINNNKIANTPDISQSNKQPLTSFFKSCLDILRGNGEYLTG